jgi:hypothetical protein
VGKRRRQPLGQSIGGMLVGFESQVLRSTPPAHELVRKGEAVRGVTGQDGSSLTVELLPDAPGEEGPTERPPTPVVPAELSSGGRRRSR